MWGTQKNKPPPLQYYRGIAHWFWFGLVLIWFWFWFWFWFGVGLVLVWFGLVWFDFGLVWFGLILVWFGLVWFGLVWLFGWLVWLGLVPFRCLHFVWFRFGFGCYVSFSCASFGFGFHPARSNCLPAPSRARSASPACSVPFRQVPFGLVWSRLLPLV